ncbi:MAG: RagB/SusD family nutrient uptake outer membrane protein, partial [Balneolales bacterium]
MKPFRTIALMLVMTCTFSCDGLLNIEPQQSLDKEDALVTSENVESTLIGAYSRMGATELDDAVLYGGPLLYSADLLGGNPDEVRWSGTFFDQREIWHKNIPVYNSVVRDIWTNAYNVINRVNNVIGALDIVSDGIRDRVEGEAKFIRGLMYFELVRYFGKAWNDGDPGVNLGVPLVLTPTTLIGGENYIGRNTVDDTYAQVLSDLTDARDLLPETNGVLAGSYTASAALSRVYLTQGDYGNAAIEAGRVIAYAEDPQSGMGLVDNYSDAFSQSSNTIEDIFAIQVSSQDGANDMQVFFEAEVDGRGDVDIEQAHLDLYETVDERLNLFYDDDGVYRSGKWSNSTDGNIQVIRLAEMYLTRAEANYRDGTEIGDTPVNDINVIRDRVDLPLKGEILSVEEILLERKL